jgi:hypothetical protein
MWSKGLGSARNAVSLDPSLVFETSIDLPAAAEGSLDAILQHQIVVAETHSGDARKVAARAPGTAKRRVLPKQSLHSPAEEEFQPPGVSNVERC